MINKKTITGMLWFFLILLFVRFYLMTLYNWQFIEQSSVAKAKVMSVVKKNLAYKTTIRFITEHNTMLEVDLDLLTEHQSGQIITIRYNPIIPAQLTRDTFLETWFSSLLTAGLFLLLAIILYVMSVCLCWKKNKDKKLRRGGNHIYTQFDAVEAVFKVKKAGKHPYQIISSWHDGAANKTYYFKSKYIWQNPIEYIIDQTITVIIDNKNKKKYVMDLNFLPEGIC